MTRRIKREQGISSALYRQYGYRNEPRPMKVRGVNYPTTHEGRTAIFLHRYDIPFDHHVLLECLQGDRPTQFEMDFKLHKAIVLPDGTLVNAIEAKGVITPEDIDRHHAIMFSHPQVRPWRLTHEVLLYIERFGLYGELIPANLYTRNWKAAHDFQLKVDVAKLFDNFGIIFKKDCIYQSWDIGGPDRPPQQIPFIVHFLFEYPQKFTGVPHELDGVIVATEIIPHDYLLIKSLKRYHKLDIGIVTPTEFGSWKIGGLFSDDRRRRGIRFGRRKTSRAVQEHQNGNNHGKFKPQVRKNND